MTLKFAMIWLALAALAPAPVMAQESPTLPKPEPPPLLARPLADEDGPSPFPVRSGFEQFIPLGASPVQPFLGFSKGHEYFLRAEGEDSLGPQMGLVITPTHNLTFFGRVDMHQVTADGESSVPGSLDDFSDSTTYTIGIGWKF